MCTQACPRNDVFMITLTTFLPLPLFLPSLRLSSLTHTHVHTHTHTHTSAYTHTLTHTHIHTHFYTPPTSKYTCTCMPHRLMATLPPGQTLSKVECTRTLSILYITLVHMLDIHFYLTTLSLFTASETHFIT